MAQSIILKRSSLAGKVPDTGSLNLGEVAVNTYDGKLYFKKSGSVESIQSIVTTDSTITGSIRISDTGSFGSLKVNDTLTVNHGTTIISGSQLVTSDLVVLGQVNARQFNISIISSSVIFQSGSTKFGDTTDDTHQFTGSVDVSGSIYLNGVDLSAGNNSGSFSGSFQGIFAGDGSGLRNVVTDDLPIDGWDYDSNSSASISEFNSESKKYIIDFQWEQEVGTPIGFKTFISNVTGSSQIVPTSEGIKFIVGNELVATVGPDGINATLPSGVVSSSAQLTSSYDTRYVLSGSITQTTWDNIASKPLGIISSSSQILDGTNIVSSSTQISNLGFATTGSNTFVGTQTLSGSIIPATDNTYDLGSATYQWRDIYVSSGSLYIDGTKVLGSTGNELQITTDEGQSIKILEAGSDSIILQSADGDIQLKTSGGGNLLFDPTSGLIDVRGTLQIQDGYKITSSGGTSIQFGSDIGITGSINGINLSTFSSSLNNRIVNVETNNFGFATTGSNTFIGTQVITGSTYISGDLIVQGSSSLQNITASAVSIGTNIVYLNTDTPAVRFAGLSVFDSGSTGATGSLFWDSENERWLYQKASGSTYSGGMLLSGPRNFGELGSEVGTLNNVITKGQGGDHITSSQITDDGTTVSIPGTLSASVFTGLGNVSEYSSSVASRILTIEGKYATTGSNNFNGNQIITGSIYSSGPITGSNGLFNGGIVQVGNITTNATLKISGDNSGGDTYINFLADNDATKAQIQGSKNGATGGMIYLKTLQSGTLTTAVTVNQLGNTIFAGTITENSSLRYKENVETIKYGLDKVLQMRGVTYDKKDNGVKEMGVIAEEIYDVLPEVVMKNEEGEIDSVSYGRIVGVLIEAIKDLKKEIEDLKSNR